MLSKTYLYFFINFFCLIRTKKLILKQKLVVLQGVLDYFTTGCNDFLLIFIHDFEEDKTQVTGMHVIAMGQTLSVFNYT